LTPWRCLPDRLSRGKGTRPEYGPLATVGRVPLPSPTQNGSSGDHRQGPLRVRSERILSRQGRARARAGQELNELVDPAPARGARRARSTGRSRILELELAFRERIAARRRRHLHGGADARRDGVDRTVYSSRASQVHAAAHGDHARALVEELLDSCTADQRASSSLNLASETSPEYFGRRSLPCTSCRRRGGARGGEGLMRPRTHLLVPSSTSGASSRRHSVQSHKC